VGHCPRQGSIRGKPLRHPRFRREAMIALDRRGETDYGIP